LGKFFPFSKDQKMPISKDFLAYIWRRIPGMAGPALQDIYAANNMITLTSMVRARGLATGEFVRYGRSID
jgi:hypothetical protein